MIERAYNKPEDDCRQVCPKCRESFLCDHNMADASIAPDWICNGFGGKCVEGSAWNHYDNLLKRNCLGG